MLYMKVYFLLYNKMYNTINIFVIHESVCLIIYESVFHAIRDNV